MLKFPIPMIKTFPKAHLIAVAVCAVLVGGFLIVLPSEEVEARRTEIPLPLDTSAPSVDKVAASIAPLPAARSDKAVENAGIEESTVLTKNAAMQPSAQEPEQAPAENWSHIQVKNGDNLTTVFSRAGLGANDLYPMLNALKAKKDKRAQRALQKMFPGEEVAFLIDEGKLKKLRHIRSPLESTLISKTDSGFDVSEEVREPEIRLLFKSASIEDSLFLAGEKAGMSQTKIMELANIFGWDVDFALDIREGDRFSLIYEEQLLDGQRIGEGNIVVAQFTNQDKTFTAVRYTDTEGNSNYFTPEGRSMRKAFLRTPVDFKRISSRYNPNRKHPIFKTNRPHRGVDYAAPTGTPIKSSGDGKVIFAGRKGGYGKTVIVQHGQKYNTLYAHMSRIKPGMKRGTRVKQGQVIGYVGSTGYATGPHLHYEFRINGVHRNPLTVPLPQAQPLPKQQMSQFKPLAQDLISQLELHQQTKLATQ